MRVIGTAGHVDHGKSTLVEALTGVHPDRLKEEREREMTIDLGFAWLTLPDGEETGIVDVPGHRDFIENMLAGVGGIDAALFVIAADEGVMPQTREHLAILNILQIGGGVVALTKVDLIDDPEWLDLVEEDVRRALSGSVLEKAPIIRVSARSRQGLDDLLRTLETILANRPPRPDLGKPRLPVDRVFTIAGFGTVVTGTLSDGRLQAGDEVQVLPGELRARVRGLQTHKRKEDISVPGSRTAVNLAGVDVDQVRRGDVLAHPGDYSPTRRLDVRFRLLPDASQPLAHHTEVKFFIGASEVLARLRLLGYEELAPGEQAWLQLELEQPVVAVRGDRYILRRPSPGETLGGGVVVDPHPKGRHKRFSEEALTRLEALSHGTPAEVLMQALSALGPVPYKDAVAQSNLEREQVAQAVEELAAANQLVNLDEKDALTPESLVASQAVWEQLRLMSLGAVDDYHRASPLRSGMPREELKSRLKLSSRSALSPRAFLAILRKLVRDGDLSEQGPVVLRPGHTVRFTAQQQRQVDDLLKQFTAAPYAPPTIKESQALVGEDVYNALLETGVLLALSPEVVFRRQDYEAMLNEVRRLIEQNGSITAAQVRDHFNTSRRYALALLEYLDAQGITLREGDARRLKR